jgi:hypothetical protein
MADGFESLGGQPITPFTFSNAGLVLGAKATWIERTIDPAFAALTALRSCLLMSLITKSSGELAVCPPRPRPASEILESSIGDFAKIPGNPWRERRLSELIQDSMSALACYRELKETLSYSI